MPGRQYTLGKSYRYGFNGKEADNEVKGKGVQYDYGFRFYDSRVGRFLSTDPLINEYPWFTPYQFASNNPMANIDLDGMEAWAVNPATGQTLMGPLDMSRLQREGWQTGMLLPPSKPSPIPQPQTQKTPVLQVATESTGQDRINVQKAIAVKKAAPSPRPIIQTIVTADTRTPYQRESDAKTAQYVKTVGDAMQTPEGQGGMALGLMMYGTARAPINAAEHAYGAYEGVKYGNYWDATKNVLLFALDVAPFVKIPGLSGVEVTTISVRSSASGAAAEMAMVRTIAKGEKLNEIMYEAKKLTYVTGNEHALVKFPNGERALVSGGPGGIFFKPGQIDIIFGHTHPTNALPSSSDASALKELGQSKQYVLHGGETSVVRPKE